MFPIVAHLLTRGSRRTACLLAIGGALLAQPALAAPVADAFATTLHTPYDEVEATQEVHLHIKQGRLLKLPSAVANVMVANPDVASFQVPAPDSIFVFAQSAGTTTLFALDTDNAVVAAIRLIASYDLDALRQQVEAEVPNARIRVVPAAGKGLVVRGTVRTPIDARNVMSAIRAAVGAPDEATEAADDTTGGGRGGGGGGGGGNGGGGGADETPRIVNQLQVELSAQVNIRVRVVEVARSLTHEVGLNWDAVIGGGDKFRLATGTTTTLFDAGTSGAAGLVRKANIFGYAHDGLTGVLNALSQEGMATMLAEPNLTALSGETAGFAAGGEVPVVIITGNDIRIEYKSYGVILRMTPTLLSPNRISLRIAPEVSDLTEEGSVSLVGGSVIPALKVRRAETTIELASGQSFALAGMLRSNQSQQVDGVPGLKDVPLLGRLFETERSEQEDTELVILATAYVVDPVSESDLQVPGQGLPGIDAQLPATATAGYLY